MVDYMTRTEPQLLPNKITFVLYAFTENFILPLSR